MCDVPVTSNYPSSFRLLVRCSPRAGNPAPTVRLAPVSLINTRHLSYITTDELSNNKYFNLVDMLEQSRSISTEDPYREGDSSRLGDFPGTLTKLFSFLARNTSLETYLVDLLLHTIFREKDFIFKTVLYMEGQVQLITSSSEKTYPRTPRSAYISFSSISRLRACSSYQATQPIREFSALAQTLWLRIF